MSRAVTFAGWRNAGSSRSEPADKQHWFAADDVEFSHDTDLRANGVGVDPAPCSASLSPRAHPRCLWREGADGDCAARQRRIRIELASAGLIAAEVTELLRSVRASHRFLPGGVTSNDRNQAAM